MQVPFPRRQSKSFRQSLQDFPYERFPALDGVSFEILIRDCSNYRGLVEGYYRVAIRLHDENVKLIEAMRAGANCKSNSSRQCCEQP